MSPWRDVSNCHILSRMDPINPAAEAAKNLGMVLKKSAPAFTYGWRFSEHAQECHCCNEWMGPGSHVVLRYKRNWRGKQYPKAAHVACAVTAGWAKYMPGKEPEAKPAAELVPWEGKGVQQASLTRYGTKWGV